MSRFTEVILLLAATLPLLIGLCTDNSLFVQTGIGWAVLYVACEFRHYYEDWRKLNKIEEVK